MTTDLAHNFFDFSSDNFVDTEHHSSSADFNATTADSTFQDLDFHSPMFQPVNPIATTQTVSPKDLLVDSMSAPPSSAMTNLSTPGTHYDNSPYLADSTDPSPFFEDDHFDDNPANWKSLFDIVPDAPTSFPAPIHNEQTLHQSIEFSTPPHNHQPTTSSSSVASARGTPQTRHVSLNGVGRRRRDKPLPAIDIPDPSDIVAVKRARNTAAARKSRAKKMANMDEMAKRIEELERERDEWRSLALAKGT